MIDSAAATRRFLAAAGLAFAAACAPMPGAPPAPPPPPPPPVAEVVPPRPVPPPQSAYTMQIPPRDALGQRRTINTGLDANATLWHFRSGWNVAALNCTRPEDAAITTGYSRFLQQNARALSAANSALDADFRRSAGTARAGLLAREQHMTMVYNYFASPSARAGLCAAALGVATEMTAAPADLAAFSANGLARYEAAFEQFYTSYEEYQQAAAAWDARYGAEYGPSQQGWVATYGNPVQAAAAGLVPLDPALSVVDPLTGASIPVLPVDPAAGTPVVQPLPGAND